MHSADSTAASITLIVGTGGIAQALCDRLRALEPQSTILQLGRSTHPRLDYNDENTLQAAAHWVATQCDHRPLRRIIVATGFLHDSGAGPERTWAHLDAAYLQQVFLVNAIGPALVIKHFLPLLAKQGRVEAAFLSAKVGSIGDNALGGWYGYRAAKAALNQLVKSASIELTRKNKESICIALHPGTVDTALSAPFAKTGLNVRPAAEAAADLIAVINGLTATDTGRLWDYKGGVIEW